MITFYETAYVAEGKNFWVEISSEYADYVAFCMGGEQNGERFSDEDPIAMHSIHGERLDDLKRYADDGTKAEWMGTPQGPMTSGPFGAKNSPDTEMQVLDFDKNETSVTISMKRYLLGRENEGHSFSHSISREYFNQMVEEITSLSKYSDEP